VAEGFHYYLSPNGFMTKAIFVAHMKENILPEIKMRQLARMEGEQKPHALFVLDGHSSRLCRELWEDFAKEGIDVVVLPSHTSHLTQPLDITVNGLLKRCLQVVGAAPAKSKMGLDAEEFFEALEDAVEGAMRRKAVREGFSRAAIYPPIPDAVLSRVPYSIDFPKTEPRRTGREISGEEITSEAFLEKWKELELQKEKMKSTKRQRKEEIEEKKEGGDDKKKRKKTEKAKQQKKENKGMEEEEEREGEEKEKKEGTGNGKQKRKEKDEKNEISLRKTKRKLKNVITAEQSDPEADWDNELLIESEVDEDSDNTYSGRNSKPQGENLREKYGVTTRRGAETELFELTIEEIARMKACPPPTFHRTRIKRARHGEFDETAGLSDTVVEIVGDEGEKGIEGKATCEGQPTETDDEECRLRVIKGDDTTLIVPKNFPLSKKVTKQSLEEKFQAIVSIEMELEEKKSEYEMAQKIESQIVFKAEVKERKKKERQCITAGGDKLNARPDTSRRTNQQRRKAKLKEELEEEDGEEEREGEAEGASQ
jgi:hypothetical protein